MIKNKGCCSLELAKQIKELGVVQKSDQYWKGLEFNKCLDGKVELVFGMPKDHCGVCSAFTVAELGILLRDWSVPMCCIKDTWIFSRSFAEYLESMTAASYTVEQFDTEADARAKMLIYLIENDLVKVSDLNKLLEILYD